MTLSTAVFPSALTARNRSQYVRRLHRLGYRAILEADALGLTSSGCWRTHENKAPTARQTPQASPIR